MPGEGRLDGFFPVVFRLLIDLHDGVQPGAAARVDIHIQAPDDFIDFFEDGRLTRHAHQQLMLERTRQQGMPDGILAVGDGFDFENRLTADDVVRLGQIDEWTFGVATVIIDGAFEDELSFSRHEQINRFSAHQVEWFIQVLDGECIGYLQLIDANIYGSGSSSQDVRRNTDTYSHIQAAQFLQKLVEMAAAHHPDSHLGFGELHEAVEIQVLTIFRVAGDEHPRADITAPIQGAVAQDGQGIQVGLVDDHFLAGRRGNHRAGCAVFRWQMRGQG